MSLRWDVSQANLDPELLKDICGLFEPDASDWAITYGFRTFDEQNALYQKHLKGGPLAAAPGHSPHEFGLAIDFAEIVNGKLLWDDSRPSWARIRAVVDASPRLHGGWKFPPEAPADPDHIQAVKFYALRDKLKAEGKW